MKRSGISRQYPHHQSRDAEPEREAECSRKAPCSIHSCPGLQQLRFVLYMSPAQPGMIALALILAEILAFRLWSTSSISVSRFLFIVSRLETVLPFSLYINNKLTEPFQRYHVILIPYTNQSDTIINMHASAALVLAVAGFAAAQSTSSVLPVSGCGNSIDLIIQSCLGTVCFSSSYSCCA